MLEESAEKVRARVQAARREAGSLEEFVAAGYREYFGFLADDPEAFALMRRNSGTIRAMFDEPIFGAGIDELAADLRAAMKLGIVPRVDAEYMAAAMVGAALEVGVAMIQREPPDVEGATQFATRVFLGGIERLGSAVAAGDNEGETCCGSEAMRPHRARRASSSTSSRTRCWSSCGCCARRRRSSTRCSSSTSTRASR